MASRMDSPQEGWFFLGDLRALGNADRLHEQAMKEIIRQMADDKSHRTRVFCYLRGACGGRPVAFAW
ncbi:MAG: hypothetical protein ACE15C_16250 [Phycisphaerae bacterium]